MKLNSKNSNVSKYSQISKQSASNSISASNLKENKSIDRNNTAGFNNSVVENTNDFDIELNPANIFNEIKDISNSLPLDEISHKKINYTKEEAKDKINSIFLNFAKYCKEEKEFLLSQQSLIKIIKKLNLIDDINLKLSDVDIIFRKVNAHSNKLNDKGFLDFMVKLIHKLSPNEYKENPKECINSFIANTFEPYCKFIEECQRESELKCKSNNTFLRVNLESLFIRQYDSRITGLINNVYLAIREIYLNYFHYEINGYKEVKKIEEGSLASLTDFCKDFGIVPFIASIHQLVVYYNIIIKLDLNTKDNLFVLEEKRELGCLFTLSKFCLLFIHFSILSHSKTNVLLTNKNVSDVDKLILFLEKLENSWGFLNLERKTNKPHSNKLSLIPSKFVLKMVDIEILKSCNIFNDKENYYSCTYNMNNEEENKFEIKKDQGLENKILKEFNEKCNTNEEYDLRSLLAVNNEVFNLLNSKIYQLKDLYKYYTKIGDKLHFNRMNFSSFLKFVKDCNIITQVPDNLKKSFYNVNNNMINNYNYTKSSPISSNKYRNVKNYLSLNNSNSVIEKKINNEIYTKTLSLLVNSNKTIGKITETDANIIFFSLTGPKNFDNSSKIKLQFDKNCGYNGTFDENGINGNSTKLLVPKENSDKNMKVNVQNRMDFFLFIKSFELIATKLYPLSKLNEAVLELIDSKLSALIIKLENQKDDNSMVKMLEKINKPEIKKFLKEIQNFIHLYYEYYSNNNFIMSYEQFKDFYKDFSLFPDIINIMQLKNIFSVVSEIYSIELIQNRQINIDNSGLKSISSYDLAMDPGKRMIQAKNECINFPLFMDSLALTALHFKFNQNFKELDKLIYLVERINQSKGLVKLQVKTGKSLQTGKDLVGFLLSIKDKYPQFYNEKVNSQKNFKTPISFESAFYLD